MRTNTLSVLSGAVFVVIGVAFLRSHGTAKLPTMLDIDAQFAVQEWARGFAAVLPDVWILLVLSLVATAVTGVRAFRV